METWRIVLLGNTFATGRNVALNLTRSGQGARGSERYRKNEPNANVLYHTAGQGEAKCSARKGLAGPQRFWKGDILPSSY